MTFLAMGQDPGTLVNTFKKTMAVPGRVVTNPRKKVHKSPPKNLAEKIRKTQEQT